MGTGLHKSNAAVLGEDNNETNGGAVNEWTGTVVKCDVGCVNLDSRTHKEFLSAKKKEKQCARAPPLKYIIFHIQAMESFRKKEKQMFCCLNSIQMQ